MFVHPFVNYHTFLTDFLQQFPPSLPQFAIWTAALFFANLFCPPPEPQPLPLNTRYPPPPQHLPIFVTFSSQDLEADMKRKKGERRKTKFTDKKRFFVAEWRRPWLLCSDHFSLISLRVLLLFLFGSLPSPPLPPPFSCTKLHSWHLKIKYKNYSHFCQKRRGLWAITPNSMALPPPPTLPPVVVVSTAPTIL